MSLILLFVGAGTGTPPPVVVTDTHDGVWDDKKYRALQERLRKQRERLAREDDKRKLELRRELIRLYRGLPEEQIEQAKAALSPGLEIKEPERVTQRNVDSVMPILNAMSENLAAIQIRLIEEYNGLLAREALRREADEEEEIELIAMAVL